MKLPHFQTGGNDRKILPRPGTTRPRSSLRESYVWFGICVFFPGNQLKGQKTVVRFCVLRSAFCVLRSAFCVSGFICLASTMRLLCCFLMIVSTPRLKQNMPGVSWFYKIAVPPNHGFMHAERQSGFTGFASALWRPWLIHKT